MTQHQNRPVAVEDPQESIAKPPRISSVWPYVVPVLCVLAALSGFTSLGVYIEGRMDKLGADIQSLQGATAQHRLVNDIYLKILIQKPHIDPSLAFEIAEVIYHESTAFQRPPNLLIAMAEHESDFDPGAVSSVGAQGLLQVMPQWKKILGSPGKDLTDLKTNVRWGLQILGSYENHYQDLEHALTAYNRGSGPVDTALMREQSPNNGYAGRILKTYERLNAIDRAQIKQ